MYVNGECARKDNLNTAILKNYHSHDHCLIFGFEESSCCLYFILRVVRCPRKYKNVTFGFLICWWVSCYVKLPTNKETNRRAPSII